MIIQRAKSEELVDKIDNMWYSYLVSFPADAQRTKIEIKERLKPIIENGFKREIFYATDSNTQELQTIGVYHINQNFPFCYGEYIWTKNSVQNNLNGTNIHFSCIDFFIKPSPTI